MAGQLAEKEKENREYVIEIKRNLEVHLAQTNLINKLNYQLTDVTEINKAFKDKVYDLEKEKEVLLEKIAEE